MEDGAAFCSGCGSPLQNQNMYITPEVSSQRNSGLGIAALVLGIIGLLAWIIPIIGLPVGLVALILGICGIKKSSKVMSIAGIVLGIICLVLTIINGAIGAYQGYHGEAWFQKGYSTEENKVGDNRTNEFALKDKDGNVLMTGGISSATAKVMRGTGYTEWVVEITFTDSASEEFAKITQEHIGEPIGIYLNDELISNPIVTCEITGGTCLVTGDSYDETAKLAEMLSSCK